MVLKPITDARLEVVPRHQRKSAIAAMARATGRPVLRSVPEGRGLLTGDPDNDDVVIGMYARLGCADASELVGLVRLRERYAPRITAVATNPAGERAFLIDALTIVDSMLDWHPPVRTLLAATAATTIATILHDPSFRTYVAYRVPDEEAGEESAMLAIGGHRLSVPPGMDAAGLCFVDVPSTELRFLDASAAASTARIVRDHMSGGTTPSYEYGLPGRDGQCQAILSIAFPRPLCALREEIDMIARSQVDLGWQSPKLASNDTGFPLRFAHG